MFLKLTNPFRPSLKYFCEPLYSLSESNLPNVLLNSSTFTSCGIIKGRETNADVKKLFQWIISDFSKYDKEVYLPANLFKDQEIKITISKGVLSMIKLTSINDFINWAETNKIDYEVNYEYNNTFFILLRKS